jgi:two-component system chemotaxis sensor kinase CheA
MNQFDQEMWQDFVVESQENLQELEPNLLLLEQRPDDIPLLNDCFRNMHSVKGTAGYMGLTGMSTLAHSMENVFDKVRKAELSLGEESINLMFAGVDRLKTLLQEVAEEHAESTDVSDLLRDIETVLGSGEKTETHDPSATGSSETPPTEDDEELLGIYAEEMKNLFCQLQKLTQYDTVGTQTIVSILSDMERVTNYVGVDELLDKVRDMSKEILNSGNDTEVPAQTVKSLTEKLHSLIEPFIGSLGQDESSDGDTHRQSVEDDQELFEIFITFVKEQAPSLATIPADPSEEWLSEAQVAAERIKASAHYMDYDDVVALMDEWSERVTEALSKKGKGQGFDPGPLHEIWTGLTNLLPGVKGADEISSQQDDSSPEEGGIGSMHELETAIDELFGDMGQHDMGAQAETPPPAEERERETEQAPVSASPEIPQKKTEKKKGVQSTTGGAVSQTVRIDLERVEQLLGDVGELVVLRASLTQINEEMKGLYRNWMNELAMNPRKLKPYKDLMVRLGDHTAVMSRVVNQLQDGVMRIRMLPVSHLFNRYPRMVRDLATKLQKKVELRLEGEETSLDKRVIEQMADPLLHIIRNAIDHGIEPAERRTKIGKPAAGTLTLSASQEGNFVVLKIADDGKGLDRDTLIRKAVSMGLVTPDESRSMSDERVWQTVFSPGMTTAEDISETSGRGVGMDVVKRNVERIGGIIKIQSVSGQGTAITIRIPLTLAIIQALLVRIGRQTLAVPLSSVQESLRISAQEISSVEGFEIISLRQQTLPLIRLSRIFRGTGAEENPKRLFVVVVKQGEFEAGLGVDRLLGQQEVVIKPLADYLTNQPGFSGATVLGDGSLALILDIPAVMDRAKEFISRRQKIMEQSALNLDEFSGMIH